MAAMTVTPITFDPVYEANTIILRAVSSEVTSAIQRAETCGCRSCKAQAMEATEWARDLLEAA
jgi:hypothetical protein